MWNKLRENVKRLLFKCLRVFMLTLLETSVGIRLQSRQWAALDVACWRHAPGQVVWSTAIAFHLENTASEIASQRDWVFWLKIHSSPQMHAWKNDPCVTWSNFVFQTSSSASLAGHYQRMVLLGNPDGGNFIIVTGKGGGGRRAESQPALWCWSRTRGGQCNNSASRMISAVSKCEFHVSMQIQASAP